MSLRIACYGLGAMGRPIAQRLRDAGHAVTGTDQDAARCTGFAPPWPDPDAAIICVTDDAALRDLLWGSAALLDRLPRRALLIDHTTAAPETARQMADRHGPLAVDAPLSGGVAGAQSGQLSAMLGGAPDAVRHATPIIGCYARHIAHLGGPGAGQLGKAANQVAIAGIAAGLCEAVALLQAGGLDLAASLQAIASGNAASAQLLALLPALGTPRSAPSRLFSFLRKDLAIAQRAAAELGASLPATAQFAATLTA